MKFNNYMILDFPSKSANEAFARSVAEASLAYMLCALRDIPYYNNRMQKGLWKAEVSHGRALNDQTVGIIGYGAISKYLLDFIHSQEVETGFTQPR